ncbi:hypothetical protein AAGQ96_16935 [Pantoea sp. MBD-2R]|uniref:hypothetical protein n=1 Tax=unclassified Pantoea TaxID=2630326 RepID=UPI0011BE915E|nr:hypothetical protein [Pantoea sp. CCBC3-3-1]
MFSAICKILPLLLLASHQTAAGKKQPERQPTEAIVFINSAFLTQTTLVQDINRQLAYSQQIRSRLTVTIVDIYPRGNYVLGPANYIKAGSGAWVGKYRPGEIPALICLKGGKMRAEKFTAAQEIRTCL